MTFRDDTQRGAVCHALCAWIPKSPWQLTETGYRPRGDVRPRDVSSGELAMIRFARALWAGEDLVIFLGWDGVRMRDVLGALQAMNEGPEAVDEWLRIVDVRRKGYDPDR